ncbi:unnamed protein product, partial [Echinostoma caproni]|uniref:E3 ubiquitin-protein ligase n=1 Tax=Echinostoma caproni TaxID=27848 RepID=A0A183ATL0_9TREM
SLNTTQYNAIHSYNRHHHYHHDRSICPYYHFHLYLSVQLNSDTNFNVHSVPPTDFIQVTALDIYQLVLRIARRFAQWLTDEAVIETLQCTTTHLHLENRVDAALKMQNIISTAGTLPRLGYELENDIRFIGLFVIFPVTRSE